MATEQYTGNNPAEDDPTPREYEVIYKLRLTKRIDSSAAKMSDDLDVLDGQMKKALEGLGYTVEFTDATAEPK